MGGIGSGTWHRWNKKTTLEQVIRIDVRFMRKKGYLKPHSSGTLSWAIGGEPSGSIGYTCLGDSLILKFKYQKAGGELQDVTQHITITSTPCHFGSSRPWFICPNCDRRVGILAARSKLFLCRHCYNLPHASVNEPKPDRLLRKRNKLEKKLFDGSGYRKKKGLHQVTFDRHYRAYIDVENKIEDILQSWADTNLPNTL